MPHPLRSLPGLLLLLGLALLPAWLACNGASTANSAGPKAGSTAAADQEWLWLERSKRELDQKRAELASLEAGPGRPAISAGSATERLAREVSARATQLDRRLIDFINADPPVQGTPLTRRQQAALRMKSDEDLALAREHILKGGDYERAAEICEAALAVDPDNGDLKAELARIRAARYMTPGRFAAVKRGMTPAEVRALLGAPNPKDVRAYPERGVEAWFYPKDETGAAAGVWFEKRSREEETRVYQLDFDAVRAAPPPAANLPHPAAPAPPARPTGP
jgi:outer membrane protein assembly factor BamE (lipoprotein component of BamABCDE complex)